MLHCLWTLNKFSKTSVCQWAPQSKAALNARIIALLLPLNVKFLFSLNVGLFLYYESARTDLPKNFSGLYRQSHSKVLIFLFTVKHAKERTRIFVQWSIYVYFLEQFDCSMNSTLVSFFKGIRHLKISNLLSIWFLMLCYTNYTSILWHLYMRDHFQNQEP